MDTPVLKFAAVVTPAIFVFPFASILTFSVLFVPSVSIFVAGVKIDVPPPTPKVNPELSTNVVTVSYTHLTLPTILLV